jgi:predicted DNA-binding protein (MmcQ/YjbR family)
MSSISPDQARQWLLETFPGAWEDFPFGPGSRVFKNAKGKMFAVLSDESATGFRVTAKLTHDEAAEVLLFPFVRVAPYLGRHGWITVEVHQEAEWDLARDWVARSWELVTHGKKATPPSPQ